MTQDLLNEPTVQFDENKNYLEELVGDGKKFKDYEALAKGKAYADAMIEHMKAEQAAIRNDYNSLRNEYNARAKLEDLVEKFSTQQPSSSEEPHVNEDRTPPLDFNKIGDIVSSEIQKREQSRREEENFNQVKSKLTERFGSNYQNVLQSQIEEIGLTKEELNDLARRNPKLLYKALKLDEQRPTENFQAPPQSQRRSDHFAPTVTKRNWAYYEKIRTDKPDLYYDPKTQVQMHKDAQEQKDAFYD